MSDIGYGGRYQGLAIGGPLDGTSCAMSNPYLTVVKTTGLTDYKPLTAEQVELMNLETVSYTWVPVTTQVGFFLSDELMAQSGHPSAFLTVLSILSIRYAESVKEKAKMVRTLN